MRGMFTTALHRVRCAASPAIACALATTIDAQTPRPTPTLVWAPKPTSLTAYTSPQKPWVKLADLKARHTGDANWREVIVDDGRLTGEYVAAAPAASRPADKAPSLWRR